MTWALRLRFRRRHLILPAVMLAGTAAWSLRYDPDLAGVRARLLGYRGCLCSECADVYGFGPVDEGWGCRIPSWTWRDHRRVVLGLGVVSSLPAFVGFVPRRRDRCRCGYPREGLPTSTCPECGRTADT